MEFLRFTILCLCLLIWTVVGFAFWIPFLFRSVALFSSMTLYATLTRTDAKPFGRQLHQAIVFYSEGFRKILEALESRSSSLTEIENVHLKHVGRFMLEIVWAIFFWGLLWLAIVRPPLPLLP